MNRLPAEPAVAECGNEVQARRLLELLSPYAERIVVVGYGATIYGAVSQHLGVLHGVIGEHDLATRKFERATALHQSAHAATWAARSRAAEARCASA